MTEPAAPILGPEIGAGIDADLAARLVREQFPQWADLPVVASSHQGHDNRTYRLGDELSVRLPASDDHALGTPKEHRVLPLVAGALPVDTPELVAIGAPSPTFNRPWSVLRRLPGRTPDTVPDLDTTRFAHDLGVTLRTLRGLDTSNGPWAGMHSFHRGVHPGVYGAEVQQALTCGRFADDEPTIRGIWSSAMRTVWRNDPVWFHGDIARGNILVDAGRLSALIDWGTSGVGDPACDLTIAWTFLNHHDRRVFAEAVQLDADTWRRARAWALWKAVTTIAIHRHDPLLPVHEHTYGEVLADPVIG